ncbi:hypothetical protein [Candidatus Endomicrobiellum trichonymphae]|nr:hypothetical protein [Candidatus Endomicrobium trichonymphae]
MRLKGKEMCLIAVCLACPFERCCPVGVIRTNGAQSKAAGFNRCGV